MRPRSYGRSAIARPAPPHGFCVHVLLVLVVLLLDASSCADRCSLGLSCLLGGLQNHLRFMCATMCIHMLVSAQPLQVCSLCRCCCRLCCCLVGHPGPPQQPYLNQASGPCLAGLALVYSGERSRRCGRADLLSHCLFVLLLWSEGLDPPLELSRPGPIVPCSLADVSGCCCARICCM